MSDYTNSPQKLRELKNKTFFIFDMDGTIYLGDKPLPNAVDLIAKINSSRNKRMIYFTNNASKDPSYYLEKLNKLDFPASKEQILTSADVLIKFLKSHRKNKSIYLVGTPYLENMFKTNNIDLTSDKPDIVVTSFDTTLTYNKLERACTYIRDGAEWLTTHPDINCPVEYGYIPDCGAINELIRASTGEPLPKAFGKPYGEVIDMIEEIYRESRANMAMFGDRLYTDIALGKKNNMTAVLLLTGEGTLDEALKLPKDLQPDIIFENLFEAEKYLF
ncbi:MAG: HAD-IIA family hydrolase [Oscillospiraceae bacterium]|nr:HAD-IIA family hydrolase [Oscillospiraceae bacterium]